MTFYSRSNNRVLVVVYWILQLLLCICISIHFRSTEAAVSFIGHKSSTTPVVGVRTYYYYQRSDVVNTLPPIRNIPPSRRRLLLHDTVFLQSAVNGQNDDSNKNIQEQQQPECSLDEGEASAGECLQRKGYIVDTSSFVTVSQVYVAHVESLRDSFPSFDDNHNNIKSDAGGASAGGSNVIKSSKKVAPAKMSIHHPLFENFSSSIDKKKKVVISSHSSNLEYNSLVSEQEVVLVDSIRKPGLASISRAFHRAGPRKQLHFDPTKVNAAIVTCGGLCPGLNNVIRELVHSLYYLYDARQVWGVRGGFHGFHAKNRQQNDTNNHDDDDDDTNNNDVDNDIGNPNTPILLTNALVENIHHEGGTVLRSSRGGFDIDEIITFLQEKDIQHLYIIGGDGTHRGAFAIHEKCQALGLNIAIAGIPKTIDNDVDYIDRSFGFLSAVEAAQASIRSAKTEAMCFSNGIGIIKLMGRSAGFLAAFAALGSGDVDAVLLPEVPIVLDGPLGILPFLKRRIEEQNYAVAVVAEGAGSELFQEMKNVIRDAGGNKQLPPIGEFIKDKVTAYFKEHGMEASIKYIDPSYTVRSVPANAVDSMYCMLLAQNAVHGAMAGFTGFSVGLVNNAAVYLPIPQLVASSPRAMDPYGKTWDQILSMTGQPNTVPKKTQRTTLSTTSSVEPEFPSLPEPMMH